MPAPLGDFFSSIGPPRPTLERCGIGFAAGAGVGVGEGCAGDSLGTAVLPLTLLGVEVSRGWLGWVWLGTGLVGGDEAFHFAELCLVSLSAELC